MHAPALSAEPLLKLRTFSGPLPPAVVALLRLAHAQHIGMALHYRQMLAGGQLDLAESYREHEAKEMAQAEAIMDALCAAAENVR